MKLLLPFLLCPFLVFSQKTSVIETTDITHFWEAFDNLPQARTKYDSIHIIQRDYIDRATPFFKKFLEKRNFTSEEYVSLIFCRRNIFARNETPFRSLYHLMFELHPSWTTPPAELRLYASEIHIWKASLLLPDAEYVRLKTFLSEDEIARSEKYLFPHLRDHFIAGRGILRVLLGRYLSCPPEDLNFGYNAWGKPTLQDASGQDTIQFNLSHSNGVVLFAFQKKDPVGIDVQHLDDAINLLQTGALVFSPDEMEILQNLPPENLRTVFYQFWTRKEAYIKALGKGFSAPLNQIDVRQAPENPVLHNEHGLPETSDWFVHDFIPCPGYAAAMATKGRDQQFSFYQYEEAFTV